jgi:leucyl aminopeptidase (aminopeptidase T)
VLPAYPESIRRKLARNVLSNALQIRRGANLLIETWSGTLPWAESLVLEARILGARPMVVLEDEGAFWKSLDQAPAVNVGRVGSHDWAALKASDAVVALLGPTNTEREHAYPPAVANRMGANDHEWFRLVQKYQIPSVVWYLGRTSEPAARRYGVNLRAWRKQLIEASTVDPQILRVAGLKLADRLSRGHALRVSHPNGTRLALRLLGRTPRVDDGMVDRADVRAGNMVTVLPSGVVAVAVDEAYAEGSLVSNAPGTMFLEEKETPLREGRWTFQGGRLTAYSLAGGGGEFRQRFSKLGAGKDRPGMLSVGLNPLISTIPRLFDQERGMITVMIGRNTEYGGRTRSPRFSAYLPLRGATLEIDGERSVDRGSLG